MRKRRIFKEVLDAEEIERIIKEYLHHTDDRLKDGSHELEMVEIDYDKKEREVSCKLVVVDLADLGREAHRFEKEIASEKLTDDEIDKYLETGRSDHFAFDDNEEFDI